MAKSPTILVWTVADEKAFQALSTKRAKTAQHTRSQLVDIFMTTLNDEEPTFDADDSCFSANDIVATLIENAPVVVQLLSAFTKLK